MKNEADYSLYKCPYEHLEKECGHELRGPEGYENTYVVWCECGFRGPVFYLDPDDLRLEKRSDINGSGHGSAHGWENLGSSEFKVTEYRCRNCKAVFLHSYDDAPQIFEDMEKQGISIECVPNVAILTWSEI